MHLQMCEPQRIYKETSLLLPLIIFETHTIWFIKVKLDCLFFYRQMSVFLNNTVRICPVKLENWHVFSRKQSFLNRRYVILTLYCFQVSLLLTSEKSRLYQWGCCKCLENFKRKEKNVMFFIVFDVGLWKCRGGIIQICKEKLCFIIFHWSICFNYIQLKKVCQNWRHIKSKI